MSPLSFLTSRGTFTRREGSAGFPASGLTATAASTSGSSGLLQRGSHRRHRLHEFADPGQMGRARHSSS